MHSQCGQHAISYILAEIWSGPRDFIVGSMLQMRLNTSFLVQSKSNQNEQFSLPRVGILNSWQTMQWHWYLASYSVRTEEEVLNLIRQHLTQQTSSGPDKISVAKDA